jgi:hypothetical protein
MESPSVGLQQDPLVPNIAPFIPANSADFINKELAFERLTLPDLILELRP